MFIQQQAVATAMNDRTEIENERSKVMDELGKDCIDFEYSSDVGYHSFGTCEDIFRGKYNIIYGLEDGTASRPTRSIV